MMPMVGVMTFASTSAAGNASRAMTQNIQKHVMVPTFSVIHNATFLLKRAYGEWSGRWSVT